jgi:mannitol/fructose-specific phosphotransferase system IIA component (Ntr-type)
MSLKLVDLIPEQCIQLGVSAESKEQLIHDVIKLFEGADLTTDYDEALRAVLKREQVMSTGIGGGVAIPHAQSPAVKRLAVGLIRPEIPIEFDAIDGRPVNLVFMILGPEERGGFVRVLARISRLLYDGELQSRLLSVRTPRDAIQAIARKEESSRV